MVPNHEYISKTNDTTAINLKATHFVYALQLIGLFTLIGFVFGIILNYIKLPDVQGSWLNSHFRWQIRTFWFSLLWSIVGGCLTFILIGYVVLALSYIWVIYRIVKGWMNLIDRKEMYTEMRY